MSGETEMLAEGPAEGQATEEQVTEKVTEKTEEKPVETASEEKPEDIEIETPEEGEEGDEKPKNRSGSQKKKYRLSITEAELEARNLENAELKRRLEAFSQNQNGVPGVDREPKEDDFPNDYFAYERAHRDWSTRRIFREEMDARQQQERETRQQREQREYREERRAAYEEQADTVRSRLPDFDKVISSARDVRITNPELVEEIMASDKAALIQYYLAKNPEKVRDLNALNGRELAREVGRLEARLHLPKPKTATTATPPPSQVRGGAAPPQNLETMPMEEYVKIRNEQEARR